MTSFKTFYSPLVLNSYFVIVLATRPANTPDYDGSPGSGGATLAMSPLIWRRADGEHVLWRALPHWRSFFLSGT